jgi:hypothetical protein
MNVKVIPIIGMVILVIGIVTGVMFFGNIKTEGTWTNYTITMVNNKMVNPELSKLIEGNKSNKKLTGLGNSRLQILNSSGDEVVGIDHYGSMSLLGNLTLRNQLELTNDSGDIQFLVNNIGEVGAYGPITSVNGFFTNGYVTADGNITAAYFLGDGSLLTGITGGNSSFNQSLTDNLYAKYNFTTNNFNGTGNFTTTGNITAGWFIGNGSYITGLLFAPNTTAGIQALVNNSINYSYYSGICNYSSFVNDTLYTRYQFTTNNLNGTGNISTTGFFVGDGSYLTGLLYAPNTTAGIQALINNTNLNLTSVTVTNNVTLGNTCTVWKNSTGSTYGSMCGNGTALTIKVS